jgi:drug/metabolite transporter (DMT)-like permease
MFVFTAITGNVLVAVFILYLIFNSIRVHKASGFIVWILIALASGCISYTIGMSLWYVGVKDL